LNILVHVSKYCIAKRGPSSTTHRPSLNGYINPSIPFSSSFSSLLFSLNHPLTTHRIPYCRYYTILYHCCILSITIAVLYLPTQITCRYHNPYSFVEVSTFRPFSSSSFSYFSFSLSCLSSLLLLLLLLIMWSIKRYLLNEQNIFSRLLISSLITFSFSFP
jgi:hypothetical protein